MKRRDFIRQSTFVSVAGLLVPSSLISACEKELLFDDLNYSGHVIIVGAGAAGLYAGFILKSKGISFTILEASDQIGGRMGKLEGFADYAIDTGAQWLHGKNNILGDLIKKTDTKITLDNAESSYWFEDEIVQELPKDPYIFEEKNLPDISFKEYAHQEGLSSEYDWIVESIAGDQGAAASLLSAYWNSKDEENWVSGDEDFKFGDTYFDLIHTQIAEPIQDKIQLNTPITSINYSNATIELTDAGGNLWQAAKVIITVPMSILKLNEISFVPELPTEKMNAFSKFGMGPGMKVFMKFATKFYKEVLVGGRICGAYADDSLGKTTADNVLLAFVMGDQATYLNDLGSDAAITNALLEELDLMYVGAASASFIGSVVFDYSDKPFIKGAYGYSTIGMGNAREVAAEPINNQLFFAGEAMNTNGHHQTVHGAVESGYKAVIDLLNSVSK
jgi:monoamine oxidase